MQQQQNPSSIRFWRHPHDPSRNKRPDPAPHLPLPHHRPGRGAGDGHLSFVLLGAVGDFGDGGAGAVVTATFYSYFRGGGGADLGAEQAGYTSIGGVELMPEIAAACDVNFPQSPTTVADVCAVDPAALLRSAPWWFHASPSCRNASQANSDAGETQEDRDAGRAVARFISCWLPQRFTLENVFQYRTFDAFGSILQALKDCGYSFDYWHLNSANYGIPQTRKRLILIAKLGQWRIQRPEPTHRDGGDMFLPPWIGWFRAIEDLIPTLPESKFAFWQLARLPSEFVGSFYTIPQQSDDKTGSAFGYGCPRRSPNDPALTVTATQSAGWYKAFIVDGTANDQGRTVTIPNGDEPMMTVSANGDKRKMRAFLMRSQNTQQEGGNQVRYGDDPAMTITAQEKPRAWLEQGRTVSMTPRALSVFQSFPRSYILPEKNSLACQIIGNACCPELMRLIGESL